MHALVLQQLAEQRQAEIRRELYPRHRAPDRRPARRVRRLIGERLIAAGTVMAVGRAPGVGGCRAE